MSMKLHTVRPGDTLESIALAYYKDADLDNYIYQANTTVIQDINTLYPGQVIAIPHLPILHWLND
jgi:nucleoid-associated protein YgaU